MLQRGTEMNGVKENRTSITSVQQQLQLCSDDTRELHQVTRIALCCCLANCKRQRPSEGKTRAASQEVFVITEASLS